jgi:hypothetical protein
VVTLWDAPLLPSYPPDRIFVHLQADDDAPAIPSEQIEALHIAGQPYIQIAVRDRHEFGAEIFRWEIAATVAALVLAGMPLPVAESTGERDQAVSPA